MPRERDSGSQSTEKTICHANAQMDAQGRRVHQPAIEARLGDDAFAIKKSDAGAGESIVPSSVVMVSSPDLCKARRGFYATPHQLCTVSAYGKLDRMRAMYRFRPAAELMGNGAGVPASCDASLRMETDEDCHDLVGRWLTSKASSNSLRRWPSRT
jgi:hypothetical protein